jgi:3-oxoadipate enol-lactonase
MGSVHKIAIVERGQGVPVVLIPGLQGRWQYFEPAFDALAASCRAITYSLDGEPGSGRRFDPAAGFDGLAVQVDRVLDQLAIDRAVLCGISFGGLVALRYAVTRPARTAALILASTPGPGFHLKRRHEIYARLPWLFGPVFLAEMPARVGREIAAAIPDLSERRRFTRRQVRTFLKAPLSVSRMAARARVIGGLQDSERRRQEAAAVSVPTLVLSGESRLDYVVPTEGTSEYVTLISGARAVCIEQSGHLGCITRPRAFADAVTDFVRVSAAGGRSDLGQATIDRSRDDAA